MWKLSLFLGSFLLVSVMLVSQSVVSGSNCPMACALSIQQATTTPALAPTPIGGGENGVIYGGFDPEDVLVVQRDLSDPTRIVTVLSKTQVEEALGKELTSVTFRSMSSDGQMGYMYPFEPNVRTPRPYLAAVDLSFLSRIPSHLDMPQFWSPDGTAVMAHTGSGVDVARRGEAGVIYYSFQGNMLTWSKDGTEVYVNDGRNRLVAFNVVDGSQRRTNVTFLDEMNLPYPGDSNRQEQIRHLSFSPVSDEILLTTVNHSESRFTVFKTTSDFADASVLATFAYSDCKSNIFGFYTPTWSPNGQYVFFTYGCTDSIYLNVGDGSVTVVNRFISDEVGTLIRIPCGWSPDSHFVTRTPYTTEPNTTHILSFWDPTQVDEPVVSVPFMGVCPVWLP